MGQFTVSGSILAGPPTAGEGFPAASFNTPLALRGGVPGSFQRATGVLVRTISVASPAFLALREVGATDTVSQGTFLYMKSDNPIKLRITQDDGAGGTVVATVPVHGLYLVEFPSNQPLELLEVQGIATIEYLVCGNS